MKKPNTFLVGGVRSGTTSLYEYLAQHPEVFAPAVKGPDFFGEYPNEGYPEFFGNRKKYLSLFKKAKEKVILEGSHYFHILDAPKKIKKFNPKSKIIIILRNPVEIVQSKFNNGHLGERKDVQKALNLKGEGTRILYESLKFYRNIKNYYSSFGKKNVHVLTLNELQDKFKETYSKICKFLEIDDRFIPFQEKYSPTSKIRSKSLQKIYFWIPLNFRIFIKENLPPKLLSKIKIGLSKIMRKKTKIKRPLPEKTIIELKKTYRKEIIKTQKLIGKDLRKMWDI